MFVKRPQAWYLQCTIKEPLHSVWCVSIVMARNDYYKYIFSLNSNVRDKYVLKILVCGRHSCKSTATELYKSWRIIYWHGKELLSSCCQSITNATLTENLHRVYVFPYEIPIGKDQICILQQFIIVWINSIWSIAAIFHLWRFWTVEILLQ